MNMTRSPLWFWSELPWERERERESDDSMRERQRKVMWENRKKGNIQTTIILKNSILSTVTPYMMDPNMMEYFYQVLTVHFHNNAEVSSYEW